MSLLECSKQALRDVRDIAFQLQAFIITHLFLLCLSPLKYNGSLPFMILMFSIHKIIRQGGNIFTILFE